MEISVFKQRISSISENDRESSKNEIFWNIVFEFLQKMNEDNLRLEDEEFLAKFLVSSLQNYQCSDVILITLIIRRYTIWCDAHLTESSDYLTFSLHRLSSTTTLLLSNGFLVHIVYYKDQFTLLESTHVAIESADDGFMLILLKNIYYMREKITSYEMRSNIFSLFMKIW